MMKSRRMRWIGNVARIVENGNACRILMEKPERQRPVGRPSLSRRIIFKCMLERWYVVV
jgi:hypothetical protein